MSTPNANTRIVLISGANSGIGFVVAEKLAREHPNYTIFIGSRNAKAGQEAAVSLASQGPSVSSVQLDITSDESIASAIQTIKITYGHLDVLINNAAIFLDLTEPKLPTRDLFTQTFMTNVARTACLTVAWLPLLTFV